MPEGFLSSEEYDEQAHKLYNEGDYEGALEMLKEGLSLYPNAVELYVGLGYARLAREEFAWARHAFERAAVLDAAHEDALVGLGETLLRFGEQEQALQLFGRVADLGYDEDIELMLTMGRALYRESLYSECRDVFAKAAAARPDSAEAAASLGYALHRLGDDVGPAGKSAGRSAWILICMRPVSIWATSSMTGETGRAHFGNSSACRPRNIGMRWPSGGSWN